MEESTGTLNKCFFQLTFAHHWSYGAVFLSPFGKLYIRTI